MKHHKRIPIITAVLCCFPAILCAQIPSPNDCPTKIGILADMSRTFSGTRQPFGFEIKNGVVLAGEYLSKKNNSCIDYRIFDIQGTNANIPKRINEGVDAGIHIFIGLGSSNQAQIGKEAARNKNVIIISPTATSDTLIEANSNLVMLAPRNELIIKDLLRYMQSRKKIKKIAVIYSSNNISSRDSTMKFISEFIKAGGEVEVTVPVRSGGDLNAEDLKKLANTQSQYIFVSLLEADAAKVIAYMQMNNTHKHYIGSIAWGTYLETIRLLTKFDDLDAFYPQLFTPSGINTVISTWFVSAYEKHFNRLPTDLAAFSFDAALFAVQMNHNCELRDVSSHGVGKCLKEIQNFNGASGTISDFYLNSANRHVAINSIGGG